MAVAYVPRLQSLRTGPLSTMDRATTRPHFKEQSTAHDGGLRGLLPCQWVAFRQGRIGTLEFADRRFWGGLVLGLLGRATKSRRLLGALASDQNEVFAVDVKE